MNHKSTFLDFHKTKASVHRLVMYSSFTCGATFKFLRIVATSATQQPSPLITSSRQRHCRLSIFIFPQELPNPWQQGEPHWIPKNFDIHPSEQAQDGGQNLLRCCTPQQSCHQLVAYPHKSACIWVIYKKDFSRSCVTG